MKLHNRITLSITSFILTKITLLGNLLFGKLLSQICSEGQRNSITSLSYVKFLSLILEVNIFKLFTYLHVTVFLILLLIEFFRIFFQSSKTLQKIYFQKFFFRSYRKKVNTSFNTRKGVLRKKAFTIQ